MFPGVSRGDSCDEIPACLLRQFEDLREEFLGESVEEGEDFKIEWALVVVVFQSGEDIVPVEFEKHWEHVPVIQSVCILDMKCSNHAFGHFRKECFGFDATECGVSDVKATGEVFTAEYREDFRQFLWGIDSSHMAWAERVFLEKVLDCDFDIVFLAVRFERAVVFDIEFDDVLVFRGA